MIFRMKLISILLVTGCSFFIMCEYLKVSQIYQQRTSTELTNMTTNIKENTPSTDTTRGSPTNNSRQFSRHDTLAMSQVLARNPHNATPRILLYFTTYPKTEHLTNLQTCWPQLIANSTLLRFADVLVFLGGTATNNMLSQWETALENLPVKATLKHDKLNPGYQEGAMRAMHLLLTRNWSSGYDWVIRLNPDTLIYDDHYLSNFLYMTRISAVLGSCAHNLVKLPREKQVSRFVMTDFFAFRPDQILSNSFSDWATAANAEKQATRVFDNIITRRACVWIFPINLDGQCRVRGNGIWHANAKCTSILQHKPWENQPLWQPLMPE